MQIKFCLHALAPLMSSITHLLFVVLWYYKHTFLATSDWYGSDYWGRWNLHPFSSQQSAVCLGGTSNGNIPRWSSDWDWHFFFFFLDAPPPSPKEPPSWVPARIMMKLRLRGLISENGNVWAVTQLTSTFCLNEVVLCFIPGKSHLSHSGTVGLSKVAVKTHICHIC